MQGRGQPPLWRYLRVTIGPDGDLCQSDDDRSRIQMLFGPNHPSDQAIEHGPVAWINLQDASPTIELLWMELNQIGV